MKTMKYILALLTFLSLSLKAQEEITKTFPAEKNDDLFITVTYGDVTINIWNKNEVKLSIANIDDEAREDLTLEKTGKKIILRYGADYSKVHSSVVAYIPAELNLEIRDAAGGGSTKINGSLIGNCKIYTSGGDVSVKDISGDLNINTSGGDILTGNVKGATNLSTAGGDITTGDLAKSIKIATAGGDIKTGFLSGDSKLSTAGGDIKIGGTNSSIKATTAGGNIEAGEVISESCYLATSGGSVNIKNGKGDLELRTSGGNIRVDQMSGNLEVSTAGGNITLKEVAGEVEGSTSGGNISFVLNPSSGSSSTFNNAGGNIIAAFPSDAKTTVEVTIDLNLIIEKDEIGEYLKSEYKADSATLHKSQKKITARYTINGGGSTVTLKTYNGNIELKKSK